MSEAIQLAAFDQAGKRLKRIEAAYRKVERAAKAANRVIENVDLEKVYRAGIDLMDRAKLRIYALAAAQERAVSGAVRLRDSWKSVYEAIQKAVSAASLAAAETVTVKTSGEKKEDGETKFGFQDAASKGIDLLTDKFKNLKYVMLALQGLSAFQKMSDAITQSSVRLERMNDGVRTLAELERKVLGVASRTRTNYFDMEKIISNLGISAKDMFGSTAEVLAFSELMTKNVAIGGGTQEQQSAASEAISNAMISGSLDGEDAQLVQDNAPILAGAIESNMRSQGMTGTMGEWAQQGLITAQVVKNAMFTCADETEQRFRMLPMTWAQVWTIMANVALVVVRPLLSFINMLANHLDMIGPILLGLGTAFLVFQVAKNWVAILTFVVTKATAIFGAAQTLLSIGFGVLTGNTAAASAAIIKYGSALLASPITWFIMLLAVVIGLIYAGVAAFNHFTNSAVSATGVICGAIMVLVAVIMNIVIGLFAGLIQIVMAVLDPIIGIIDWFLNIITGGFDSFGDAILNLLGQILSFGLSIVKIVTGVIDAIFGTNWSAGLTAAQEHVRSLGKNEDAMTVERGDSVVTKIAENRFDYGDAWDSGYDFGKELEDKLSGLFSADDFKLTPDDYGNTPSDDVYSPPKIDTVNHVNSVGEVNGDVNIADEDLKFLRDVAEMRYVQNFVTMTPTVSMQANVKEQADVNQLVSAIEHKLEEEFMACAEGVYA